MREREGVGEEVKGRERDRKQEAERIKENI